MRIAILSVFIFCSIRIFSQEEIEHIQLIKEYSDGDFFPHIENVYSGEIDFKKLGSLLGIQNKLGWKVISFELNFECGRGSKQYSINQSSIPMDILEEIKKCALGEMLFFTHIKALTKNDEVIYLMPFNLIPIVYE
jgi:hypothetical protein